VERNPSRTVDNPAMVASSAGSRRDGELLQFRVERLQVSSSA